MTSQEIPPPWACGPAKGLGVQGKCKNQTCEVAKSTHMCMAVYSSQSEYHLKGDLPLCPLCREPFQPTSLYFHDCEMHFTLKEQDKQERKEGPFNCPKGSWFILEVNEVDPKFTMLNFELGDPKPKNMSNHEKQQACQKMANEAENKKGDFKTGLSAKEIFALRRQATKGDKERVQKLESVETDLKRVENVVYNLKPLSSEAKKLVDLDVTAQEVRTDGQESKTEAQNQHTAAMWRVQLEAKQVNFELGERPPELKEGMSNQEKQQACQQMASEVVEMEKKIIAKFESGLSSQEKLALRRQATEAAKADKERAKKLESAETDLKRVDKAVDDLKPLIYEAKTLADLDAPAEAIDRAKQEAVVVSTQRDDLVQEMKTEKQELVDAQNQHAAVMRREEQQLQEAKGEVRTFRKRAKKATKSLRSFFSRTFGEASNKNLQAKVAANADEKQVLDSLKAVEDLLTNLHKESEESKHIRDTLEQLRASLAEKETRMSDLSSWVGRVLVNLEALEATRTTRKAVTRKEEVQLRDTQIEAKLFKQRAKRATKSLRSFFSRNFGETLHGPEAVQDLFVLRSPPI